MTPTIAAQRDFGAGDGVEAGGVFEAEEKIFGEERLAESAEGETRHAPFVLGHRQPVEELGALLRLGDVNPLAGEEIGRVEFVDEIDGSAAGRREMQGTRLPPAGVSSILWLATRVPAAVTTRGFSLPKL